MAHPIHRVTRFSIVGPYTLTVGFSDGTEQLIDFTPILHGVLFGPLQDLTTFNAVSLDADAGTLVWPSGADFDPATLHDWPQVRDELASRARAWTHPASDRRLTSKWSRRCAGSWSRAAHLARSASEPSCDCSEDMKTRRTKAIETRKSGPKGAGIAIIRSRSRPQKDPAREYRISAEVVVDAYDGAERAIGWFGYLEAQLEFPFTAKCIAQRAVSPLLVGDEVEVISMAPADECLYDMFVMIRWEHGGLGVPLSQLAPTSARPTTKVAVADWQYWVGQGYQFR